MNRSAGRLWTGLAAVAVASFVASFEDPAHMQLEASNQQAAPADSAIDKGVPPAKHPGDSGAAASPRSSAVVLPPAGSGPLAPGASQ